MKTPGHHVTLRLVEDDWIAREVADRRALSRTLYACGDERGLLAFRVTDNHLHVLLECSRETAGQFARVAMPALRRVLRLETPFESARIRPIRSLRHLSNTLAYVFEQGRRHDSTYDLAHDGSSLPELLGLRCLQAGPTVRRVRSTFPRLRRSQLEKWLGAAGLWSEDVAPELAVLGDAAAAAVALPHLRSRGVLACAVKSAAIRVGRTWWTGMELRQNLGLSRSAFHRAEKLEAPASHELMRALAGQLRLRSRLARAARTAVVMLDHDSLLSE